MQKKVVHLSEAAAVACHVQVAGDLVQQVADAGKIMVGEGIQLQGFEDHDAG